MKRKYFLFGIVFVFLHLFKNVRSNDFPSLLVANATMAVILDQEYLGDEYDDTLNTMKTLFEKVIREDLKNGGLYIKYYSWSRINFNKDFLAVFSVANCKDSWETFYAARKHSLLLFAFTDADCPRFPYDEGIMIPLIKMGQELPQILLDIRTKRAINWKTATVLCDTTFDRDIISRVANALSLDSETLAMSISLLRFNSTGDMTQRKESIRKDLLSFPTKYVGNNFMVIAAVPAIIFEVATSIGLINAENQWLFLISNIKVLGSNTSTLIPYIIEGGNVAIAVNNSIATEQCTKEKECIFYETLKSFVIALSKMVREEEAIYGQISDEEWESIRLTKKERRDDMLELIKKRSVDTPTCKPCISWSFESCETWGMRFNDDEGHKMKAFKPKLKKAATWEPTNGLITFDSLFPHIDYGFRGRKLPIATFHNPPWQIITYNENGEIVDMQGIAINILDELAMKLNFSYYVENIERGTNRTAYSYLDDFNSTIGDEIKSTLTIPADVLELLAGKKVLFGAASITVSDIYEKEVNYTYPISVQSYTMLISRPKELSRLYLFTAPFTIDTWLCLSLTIVLIGPLLYIINYLSPYYEHTQMLKKGGLFKIGNCFWYIYGALLQQGGMYLPKSDSGRLIVGTWWLVVLVVVTTYCGNLIAFLTFPKMEIPLNTVHDLVHNKNGYTWGIRTNTYLEKYLRETDINKYLLLNRSTVIHERASTEAVQLIRNGKHVFVDWKTNILHIMKKEFLINDRCDFSISHEEFLDEKIALIVPANSPYLTIINKEIYRMLQMGLIQRWLNNFLPKKDRCASSARNMEFENHTVNLADMQGCFLVLIAGVIASILIVFMECCCNRYKIFSNDKLKIQFAQ